MKKLFLLPVIILFFGMAKGQIRGMYGESDSTIIGYVKINGIKIETRYYFNPQNYELAAEFIQLDNIVLLVGFDGLNDQSNKRRGELMPYILRREQPPLRIKRKHK